MTFLPEKEIAKFNLADGFTVLELAMSSDVPLGHSCGGNGYCTTCRVFIESAAGEAPARNDIESEVASDRSFLENERLACQLLAYDGLIVRRPVDEF